MSSMTYGAVPGGYSLETSGAGVPAPPAAGGGGNDDLIQFFMEMARRKQAAAQPPPGIFGGGGGPSPVRAAQAAVPGRDSSFSLPDQNFRQMQQRDALLQMQARQQGAPMKGLSGPGVIGSAGGMDTMDTGAMNAYQREAYLPKESQRIFSPAEVANAKAQHDDDSAWNAQMAADRARTAGRTGDVGGATPGTPGGSALTPQVPQGTAPMLTPSNAAVPGRRLSALEMELQRQRNAQYGR